MIATTEWHIPHLLPKNDAITLDGPHGVGKTLFAAHLLARFAGVEGQRTLYCFTPEQEEAALQFLDNTESDLRGFAGQMMMLYPSPEMVNQVCLCDAVLDYLTQQLELSQPTFCIVDGLDDVLGLSSDLPTHLAMDFWQAIRDLAKEHQCTIVILRHRGLHQDRLYGNLTRTASRVFRHGLTMHWHPTDPGKRLINVARRQYGPIGEQFQLNIDPDGKISLHEALGNLKEQPANKCRAWKHNPVALKQEKVALSLANDYLSTGNVTLKEVQQKLQKQGLPGKAIHRALERGNFGLSHSNGECYLTRPDDDAMSDTDRPTNNSTFPMLEPVSSCPKSLTDNNIPRATTVEKPAEVSVQSMAV